MILFQIRQQEIGNDRITRANLELPHLHVYHLIIFFLRRLNQSQRLLQIGI